jgi:endonuclease/exonuclease/phosphatase family metal-dependent hydrolase
MKVLESVLPAEQADILILNEAFAAKAKPVAMLKDYPFRAFGPGKSGLNISSGVVVLSKFPIVEMDTVRFEDCAGTDCFANKGAVRARVEVPAVGVVDVVGTHLNADGKDSLRSSQLAQIDAMLARASTGVPVLFGGDFNFHSESVPYDELVGIAGYRDMHAEYRALNPGLDAVRWFGFTYDPVRNSNLALDRPFRRPDRLDYIMVRDGACTAVRVKETGLLLDREVAGLHLSDHFGVRADVLLEQDPTRATCR